MELRFGGEVIWWRGPAPFHFVALPDDEAARLRAVATHVTYGWGSAARTAAARPGGRRRLLRPGRAVRRWERAGPARLRDWIPPGV
ncbi:hypothetical protein CBP52_12510 [Cellulomonas sp. PSBB021]|nr:hypothetical protein CBP52_12510 [Cellulomonas sp. PSBB021]